MSSIKQDTFSNIKVLYEMAFYSRGGRTHADRLEAYYGKQAAHYDEFRKALLHGREGLFRQLPVPEGGKWADIGGGTGVNAEVLGEKLGLLESYTIVDLSTSLLEVAEKRIHDHGWENIHLLNGDACDELFAPDSLDVVTFSYSLTMIPKWYLAIDRAIAALKPGGTLAVVDFFVSRKHDTDVSHSGFNRHFWPMWFSIDNVFLSADHVPYLRERLQTKRFEHGMGSLPIVKFMKVPYYQFIGRKSS